jgi:dihydropteroate synthase
MNPESTHGKGAEPSLPVSVTSAESRISGLYDSDVPPLVMAIVNATPDSFFRDSRASGEEAVSRALAHIEAGADIIDIGGESSRPGSEYIPADEEIRRVIPVVEAVRRQSSVLISVDTRKFEVAQAAVSAGADIINDISALRDDPLLGGFIADSGAYVVLMHMQGTPDSMQDNPVYRDVVEDVKEFFTERINSAQAAGIPCEKIILDPGIGFGKAHEHNLRLLRHLDQLAEMGYPLLMGHSRKSFIGRILSGLPANDGIITPPEERLFGSLAVVADGYSKGARIFRVHDVAETVDVLKVLHAVNHKGV